MKLISWNVNGIRACIKKGFIDYVRNESPDVMWVQEIKAHDISLAPELDLLKEDWYEIFWNPAERPGYSGTMAITKTHPLRVSYWIWIPEYDTEWRVITLEFDNFYYITVYTPNSWDGLRRIDYRQEWDKEFLKFKKNLEEKKPVISCWDYNVAHNEIDLKNPWPNRKNAGFTDEERGWMDTYINEWFIDTFRHFYPDTPWAYTWWSYMWWARLRNAGWRIDYFLTSQSLKDKLESAFIRNQILGSDHCPVWIEISK